MGKITKILNKLIGGGSSLPVTRSTSSSKTSEKEKLIKEIIEERHNYARNIFTVTVAWFTFFVTYNSAALGLMVAQVTSPMFENKSLVWIIVAVFGVQNFLAQYYVLFARRKYIKFHHSISTYYSEKYPDANTLEMNIMSNAVPIDYYKPTFILMWLVIVSLIGFWTAVVFAHLGAFG